MVISVLVIKQIDVFNLVGGDAFFQKLVEIFYKKIELDEILRPMFPKSLEAGKHWQYLFLRKIFGGPDDYIIERGHPRLRKRHLPFTIGMKERNRWFDLMIASLEECGIDKNHQTRNIMEDYFSRVATHMVNTQITANELSATHENLDTV